MPSAHVKWTVTFEVYQPFLAPPQHADDLALFLADKNQRGPDHLRDGLSVGWLRRPRMPEGAEQLSQLLGRGEGEIEPAVGVRDEPADALRIRFETWTDGEHASCTLLATGLETWALDLRHDLRVSVLQLRPNRIGHLESVVVGQMGNLDCRSPAYRPTTP